MKKRLAVILMMAALCWMVISPIVNALGYDPDRLVNRSSNGMEGDDDPFGVDKMVIIWPYNWYSIYWLNYTVKRTVPVRQIQKEKNDTFGIVDQGESASGATAVQRSNSGN